MMGLEWVCISATTRSTSTDLVVERCLCAEKDITVGVGGVVAVVHQLGVGANLAIVAGDELEEAQAKIRSQ